MRPGVSRADASLSGRLPGRPVHCVWSRDSIRGGEISLHHGPARPGHHLHRRDGEAGPLGGTMSGLRQLRLASHRRHLSGRPLFEEPFQRSVWRDHHGWTMRGEQRNPVRMDDDHRAAPLVEPARKLPPEPADEVLEDKP